MFYLSAVISQLYYLLPSSLLMLTRLVVSPTLLFSVLLYLLSRHLIKAYSIIKVFCVLDEKIMLNNFFSGGSHYQIDYISLYYFIVNVFLILYYKVTRYSVNVI